MINLNLYPNNSVFSDCKLVLPYDYNTILSELQNETNWVEYTSTPLRTRLFHPTSKVLQEIMSFFESNEVHEQICNHAYDTFHEIQSRWGLTLEKLIEISCLHSEFNKDLPGWYQAIHMDIKHYICTGFIYFTEKDDEKLSSYFYSNQNGDGPVRAKTEFCTGWLHINDINSWHGGVNSSEDNRYTILFALCIKSLRRSVL